MVPRGDLWWIDFADPSGSAPGYRRPGVVVSSDRFNRSRPVTVLLAIDRQLLDRRIATLPAIEVRELDQGLRLVLGL